MNTATASSAPKKFYTQQITAHQAELAIVKKQLLVSSIIRLLIFIMTCCGLYYGYPNTQISIGSLVLGTIIFLYLVTRHSNLSYTKDKLQQLLAINQLELDVFDGQTDALDPGTAFMDSEHPYSHDIDLFGNHSFFQFSNRTATLAGKEKLAAVLTSNAITHIEEQQQAIKNLSQLASWRQDFGAIASLVTVTVPIVSIQKWFQNYTPFVPKFMRALPGVITGVSSVALVLLFMGWMNFNLFLLWFMIGLVITGTQLFKINALYSNANQVKDTFVQYYKLVDKIENAKFEASLLKKKQQQLSHDDQKASLVLKQFASILNAFDQRNNMLFGFLANGLLLWDIRQSYRIEKWIAQHHEKVKQWFEVIAFFDAYNSLGNFAFNHPKYVFPEITKDDTILEATALGHPMLDSKKRVTNAIKIDQEQFFIITGANMAGKSTFLRTVALQLVMANVGLPICATSCRYRPIKLYTSMRTSDSLSDDASYFFSELTQLKRIVDALEKEAYFIILDEILKGTNSKDKASGSRKFVKRLVQAKATGIIATHDLSLCEISKELPQVHNRFFDAEIINDELYFDYTFKSGICQNMNASFLLKKMGIV